MNDNINNKSSIIISPGIDELIINPDRKIDKLIPKPFSKNIFLFETRIAGTSYIENIFDLIINLDENVELNFFREPQNIYDNKAIVIKTLEGDKLGYIPSEDNIIFSRLMDAGKKLVGKINFINEHENWVHININIYLRD